MSDDDIIQTVRSWVETIVVGLNLCPFAKRELVNDRIRFAVSTATNVDALLGDLEAELDFLQSNADTETTLLIHPQVLGDFADFNQFLDLAEGLLHAMNLDGVFQLAHFHPDYQFADTEPDDAENYTNRSPYPVLHLLREDSLDKALQSTEHAEQIPVRNIELMNELGAEEMRQRLKACS